MFAPEAFKFMTRCLLVYSLALLALGLVIGAALRPSQRPMPRDYPAQYAPDDPSPTDMRRA